MPERWVAGPTPGTRAGPRASEPCARVLVCVSPPVLCAPCVLLKKLGVRWLGRERPVGRWGQKRADRGVPGVAPVPGSTSLLASCRRHSRGDRGSPPFWVLCEPGSSICPTDPDRKFRWGPQSRAVQSSPSARTRRPEL